MAELRLDAFACPPDAATPRQGALLRSWRLAAAWYASEERATALGLTAAALLLTLAQIGLALRVNLWHRDFFDALGARDSAALGSGAWLFLGFAGATMAIAVAQLWARQMLALSWRRWLVHNLQERWLGNARAYRMGLLPDSADNPDQRISENTRWATVMTVDMVLSLLHAVLTCASFMGILWSMPGGIGFAGIALPGGMLTAVLLYAAAGSLLTWLLGRPMIGLNIARNQVESDHRFALIRQRDRAEAVAMSEGAVDEARGLRRDFARVFDNMRLLLRRERHLMWLGSGYGMTAAVLPLLLASPNYLAGTLSLGALVQMGQAFALVAHALAWFQEGWPRLADWCSHVDRLTALEQSFTASDTLGRSGGPVLREGEAISLDGLTLVLPDGRTLLGPTTLEIAPGERVLIQGESGSGKSTLFRAMAGLWPWGEGKVVMPPRAQTMLLPQRPYLPLGTLAAALCYPDPVHAFPRPAQHAALERCGLGAFAGRLDEAAPWDRMLSLGEQQRLGFARLLLHRPAWALLDEATSALDGAAEALVMSLFERELAATTLVSIGHRPSLTAWHGRVLRLEAGALVEAAVPPPLPPLGRSRIAHAHVVAADPRTARHAERLRTMR